MWALLGIHRHVPYRHVTYMWHRKSLLLDLQQNTTEWWWFGLCHLMTLFLPNRVPETAEQETVSNLFELCQPSWATSPGASGGREYGELLSLALSRNLSGYQNRSFHLTFLRMSSLSFYLRCPCTRDTEAAGQRLIWWAVESYRQGFIWNKKAKKTQSTFFLRVFPSLVYFKHHKWKSEPAFQFCHSNGRLKNSEQ